jgi:soluble cytochrome b562
MHQVQLADQLYKDAQRRASEAGFSTVDEYVADVLSHDLSPDATDFDHLFTPDRLAHIDKAAAEIDAGEFYTTEQAATELAKRRAEWLRKNSR